MGISNKKIIIALVVALLLFSGVANAVESEYRATINHLMSPDFCGKSLANCPAGVSQDMRNEVREMIEAGYTKEQVLDHYVGIFGMEILANPPKEGFFLTAWIMPFVGLAVGGFLMFKVLKHRSNAVAQKQREEKSQKISEEEEEKLKNEMKKYL
ncbi:cytochrome c-type biogenesis protein CcmH [Desulfitispora alkaliphila]